MLSDTVKTAVNAVDNNIFFIIIPI